MTDNFADPARAPGLAGARARGRRGRSARGVKPRGFGAFRPEAFAPGAPEAEALDVDRLARRIHRAIGEDPFGHLARPCGPQAPDRDRRPDRGHRRARAREGHPDAGARPPRRADPRRRGRAAAAIARHLQRASQGMQLRFDARAVIVTGAAQGIGRAIATAFRDGRRARACRRSRRGGRAANRRSARRDRACARPLRARIGASARRRMWLRPRAGSTSWRSRPAACAARSAGRSRRSPKPIGGCCSRPMSTARSGSPRPPRRS